ncbi:MAG: trehalose-phosphatase [Steroidobacteraceae bacterium]
MTLRAAFVSEQRIALFLDVDGTLLEFAAAPDGVRVPAALRNTLQLAAEREDGALALISGRSIEALDRLFAPSIFPACGLHGFERRDFQGRHSSAAPVDSPMLVPVRAALQDWVQRQRGLLLEDKGIALALHYRNAPQLESQAYQAMREALRQLGPLYALRAGKCVVELAPAHCSVRDAIEAFMQEPPFAGRTPVFVSDDSTAEDAFEVVNALSGHTIRVGSPEPSVARYRFASVSGVIAWLRERNTHLMRPRR